jgi:predicted ABC-type ATPase
MLILISPFNPESAAIDAGRIMINRIDKLIHQKENFAFETTLSSKSILRIIEKAKKS